MDNLTNDILDKLKFIEKVCCEVSIEAGNKIMEVYNDVSLFNNIEYKKDNSPLTMADKLANDIIVNKLKDTFPEFSILSEESIDDKTRLTNKFCFIVDPLDGTKEFIKRNGEFTVNIALSYENESILGVIYVPVTKDLYFASKTFGSFHKNSDGEIFKLEVSKIEDLSKVRLVMSSSHGCQEMEDLINKYKFNNFVKMGSSLKGCVIAKGEAEIYYRHNPTMEWDTCAMQCIVEEAGAIFRQMDGTKMLYNREDSLNSKGFYIINSDKNKL